MATGQLNNNAPFLNLPPELRNRVYEAVLIHEEDIQVCVSPIRSRNDDGYIPPALLQTCRLVREEALPVYLGANAFKIFCTKGRPCYASAEVAYFTVKWLDSISGSASRLVRKLLMNDWRCQSVRHAEYVLARYKAGFTAVEADLVQASIFVHMDLWVHYKSESRFEYAPSRLWVSHPAEEVGKFVCELEATIGNTVNRRLLYSNDYESYNSD